MDPQVGRTHGECLGKFGGNGVCWGENSATLIQLNQLRPLRAQTNFVGSTGAVEGGVVLVMNYRLQDWDAFIKEVVVILKKGEIGEEWYSDGEIYGKC